MVFNAQKHPSHDQSTLYSCEQPMIKSNRKISLKTSQLKEYGSKIRETLPENAKYYDTSTIIFSGFLSKPTNAKLYIKNTKFVALIFN